MKSLFRRHFVLLLTGVLTAQASVKQIKIEVVPASFSAALAQSREAHHRGTREVVLRLHGGTYALAEPLVLTAEDSGLSITAFNHETPVISGRSIIRGWKQSRRNPNIWETEIPEARSGNWVFHQLFVNGRRKERTRLPSAGFYEIAGAVEGHPTELQYTAGQINPEWAKPGDVELVAYEAWAQSRNQIREVLPSNIVSLAGKALPNPVEPRCRFYIENAPVPIQPGQWHLDAHSGVLSYWPDAGEDMYSATVAAPRLYDLVRIKGSADQPASDISFNGITFADADWRMEGGSDLDLQAAVETPAAVIGEFASDCTFARCTFKRLGGYALELDRGCVHDRIIGNEMCDLGAGGVRVGESDLAGAATDLCGGHMISDNHIHDIGLVNAPAVGIFVLLSGGNQIGHNEVDHTFYTAISVGWSWGYQNTPCEDNIIEYNHLHDIGQGMLSDMGGIYTLGVQPGTIVRNNLIHDVNIFGYGGWGLYTDEGSSAILMESNIVYHCQSAGFHQHYGEDNIIRNNIFAFNKEAQLAHTRVEKHVSFIFTNNIVYFGTGQLFAGRWQNDQVIDHNFYFDTRSRKGRDPTRETLRRWQASGHDINSQFIDPLFKAPGEYNFRLLPDSPALRAGFGQIEMKDVGVRRKYRRD